MNLNLSQIKVSFYWLKDGKKREGEQKTFVKL